MLCSVSGLVDSIPLDDLDGSIRSLGCLETPASFDGDVQ
jgi:hypothetical protein